MEKEAIAVLEKELQCLEEGREELEFKIGRKEGELSLLIQEHKDVTKRMNKLSMDLHGKRYTEYVPSREPIGTTVDGEVVGQAKPTKVLNPDTRTEEEKKEEAVKKAANKPHNWLGGKRK